ncbi:MAG: InlB B-repeat-containing protein [Bacillus subtilis]|nr:InlB B-repeat-containing protein [Bacillus subtilis]
MTSAYTFTTMPAQNITLYAKWTINSYTISFNANGGSAVTSITQNYGTAVSAPADPTKTGYTFAGWYSDAGLTSAYTFTTMAAQNITLYAKWTINSYTITFNSNGGSAVGSITQNYGTAVTQPADPTKTGYDVRRMVLGCRIDQFLHLHHDAGGEHHAVREVDDQQLHHHVQFQRRQRRRRRSPRTTRRRSARRRIRRRRATPSRAGTRMPD